MGPSDIRLHVAEGGEGTYAFACPGCAEDVEKAADRKIVELLVSAGVPAGVSAGAGSAGIAPSRPPSLAQDPTPLTLDDLIEFHYALEDEAALERFLTQS